VKITPGPVASSAIVAIRDGEADEVLMLGPRGEAKTISALLGMVCHAKKHEEIGSIKGDYGQDLKLTLPVKWLGFMDTFANHKAKTFVSLEKDFWQGAWHKSEGGHIWYFKTNKIAVVLYLYGYEDKTALDRARQETCCAWLDECAPTDEGAGLPEILLDTVITSQRIPTHAPVSVLTSNYPHKGHWLWKRFRPLEAKWGRNDHPTDPRRVCFQIPKGDNKFITEAMRARARERLKHRPDLQARLLDGLPAQIQHGRAVAIVTKKLADGTTVNIGYQESRHVSPRQMHPIEGYPLLFGQDGGLTPVTTIGQHVGGRILIFASLLMDGGMRQQYQHNVVPWIRRNAPWALQYRDTMIQGVYDPSLPRDQSDSDRSPLSVIQEEVGGIWIPGPSKWSSREGVLMAMLSATAMNEKGELCHALQIDPVDGEPVKDAFGGNWYYPVDRFGDLAGDQPKKPNHPWEDIGDSAIYFGCAALPELNVASESGQEREPNHLEHEYDPFSEKRFLQ
jgi:hypothetical protein